MNEFTLFYVRWKFTIVKCRSVTGKEIISEDIFDPFNNPIMKCSYFCLNRDKKCNFLMNTTWNVLKSLVEVVKVNIRDINASIKRIYATFNSGTCSSEHDIIESNCSRGSNERKIHILIFLWSIITCGVGNCRVYFILWLYLLHLRVFVLIGQYDTLFVIFYFL